MSVLRKSAKELDAEIAAADMELRARLAEHDRAARDARNLATRAKRRGVSAAVQSQREWIKANPCGFEIA